MRPRLLIALVIAVIFIPVFFQGSAVWAWEPSDKVEFIAPANPGGGWDTICRTSVRVLQDTGLMTQPAIVTNMPGGSGSVAIAHVVEKRKGDSHLLVAASNSLTFSMAIQRTPYTYDTVTPLAQVATEYGGYVVRSDSKFKTLKDLVQALKADPKSVSFAGGSAPGSLDHIKVAILGKAIGINPLEMVYVPFQGGGEAMTSLLGGHTDLASLDISELAGQLQAGEVRVLAVTSENRLSGFPDLPTATELGVDVVFPVWRGLYLAPGLPADAVAYWSGTIEKMVRSPQWAQECKKLGWEPVSRVGADFDKFAKNELVRYRELLKELGFVK